MAEVQTIERHRTLASTDIKKMLIAALIGAAAGLVTWLIGYLIAEFVINPVFCATPDSAAICEIRGTTSFNIALMLASFGGLLAMVRTRIFRPLLVAVAAAVTLWGLMGLIGQEAWYVQLVFTVLISALAYALFTWISQLKSFVIALIISIVVLVGLRLLYKL